MKYLIVTLTVIFTLISCSKNEVEIATLETQKQDILTFKTVDEFNSTVIKVNSMKPEERIAWEKSKGFISFGTICDEFLTTVDIDKFNNITDFLKFVESNSEYVQIIEHSDSSKCFETQEFDNTSRYLMNKDKMYVIGSMVYKKFNEGSIAAPISEIKILADTKEFNNLISNQIFKVSTATPQKVIQKIAANNTSAQRVSAARLGNSYGDWDNHIGYKGTLFRIEIYLNTSNSFNGYQTFRFTNCLIKSYYQGFLGIWTPVNRIITFNATLNTSDIAGLNYNFYDAKTNMITSSYSSPFPARFICGGPIGYNCNPLDII